MKNSILQSEVECFRCKTKQNLHLHHIYEGNANRQISDRNGFVVYLCGKHHNLSNEGVHFDKTYDLALKRMCQKEYEKTHSREEFIELIGHNYLDDTDDDWFDELGEFD